MNLDGLEKFGTSMREEAMTVQGTPPVRSVDSVAIVSGGMDSVTMLYSMVKTMERYPLVLSFDYGQKHVKELELASWHCARLGVPHRVVRLYDVTGLLTNSTLVNHTLKVPEGHYADETMKATVVPNRNMMMVSIAAAAVVNEKAHLLGLGVHAGDHPIYPDCRIAFIESVQYTITIANEGFIDPHFQIYAPFVTFGKDVVASIGLQLGVDFKKTWSCYKGGDLHCGKCGTCVERKEAFHLIGADDPTIYESA
jgi:7-cyano-7-deazaguanine synthase